jgi:hypothetical protein
MKVHLPTSVVESVKRDAIYLVSTWVVCQTHELGFCPTVPDKTAGGGGFAYTAVSSRPFE